MRVWIKSIHFSSTECKSKSNTDFESLGQTYTFFHVQNVSQSGKYYESLGSIYSFFYVQNVSQSVRDF